jgi:hypothetical protein
MNLTYTTLASIVNVKVKVKLTLEHDTKAQWGQKKYSSTLSLTAALDGVVGQHHAPAAVSPGKTRYPLYRRLAGPQGRSGLVKKISPHRDHPARRESLYRLPCPGPLGGRVSYINSVRCLTVICVEQ